MNKFDKDFFRHSDAKGLSMFFCVLLHRNILALYLLRKAEIKKGLIRKCFLSIGCLIYKKSGIEIMHTDNIGGGLLLIHPYNITINSRSTIGTNFTIFKGATIGSIRSGRKEGTPHIGNRVTVCTNAMVCGNIFIGDDVLIASGAYVNFDVPSDSVVIGNPGIIHSKVNPSIDYLK